MQHETITAGKKGKSDSRGETYEPFWWDFYLTMAEIEKKWISADEQIFMG